MWWKKAGSQSLCPAMPVCIYIYTHTQREREREIQREKERERTVHAAQCTRFHVDFCGCLHMLIMETRLIIPSLENPATLNETK
jgi:hypothetical protein